MAFYLKEILKFDKKVYTVGTTGMVEEFDALKIPHTGSGVSQFFVNFIKKNEKRGSSWNPIRVGFCHSSQISKIKACSPG